MIFLNLISIFGVLKNELFFSLSSLIGYDHLGKDTSKIYIILMTILGLVNIVIAFLFIIKERQFLVQAIIVLLGIPLLFTIFFIFTFINHGFIYEPFARFYFYFLAFSVPAMFVGFYLGKKNTINLSKMSLCFEISTLILNISILASIFIPFIFNRNFLTIGGESYQTASYISAFTFGMNLYYLLSSEIKNLLKTKFLISVHVYTIVQILFILTSFISTIVPGGRGAFKLSPLSRQVV